MRFVTKYFYTIHLYGDNVIRRYVINRSNRKEFGFMTMNNLINNFGCLDTVVRIMLGKTLQGIYVERVRVDMKIDYIKCSEGNNVND